MPKIDIYNILKQLEIKYTEYKHQAIFTVEQGEKIDLSIPGIHTKNLFLCNKKNQYWLVIIEGKKRANMKKLRHFLGDNKISFASPEMMMKFLQLTPGSVSPFGLIHDTKHCINVVIYDDILKKDNLINFHPNINTATLNLTVDDFKKFLSWTSNPIINFIE